MGIQIRQAIIDDQAIITQFNQNMAMETENRTLDDATIGAGVAAVLGDSNRGFYLIAEVDGRPAGCLMVTFEWSDWRNYWFWWIQSVYVDQDFRRQGIYQNMYQAVKDLADDRDDVGGFRLYVETENIAAQKTYERLGMTRCDYLMYEAH